MKKSYCLLLMSIMVLFFSNNAPAADWRFPLGFTYSNSFKDVVDLHEDNVGVNSDWGWPVGLSFHPYVEFDNGVGFGIGIGPAQLISTSGTDGDFFNLPVNANLRYTFIRKADISPYIRGGVTYNIASGDFVEKSKIGPFGAVGVEFARRRPVGFGLEIGYDASKIEFEDKTNDSTKSIKPIGFMASIFVIF